MSKMDETRALPERQGGEEDELLPGALAGDYVIRRNIASGGFGTVYEAVHRVLGRRAAVKILSRKMSLSPEMVTRFIREARAVNVIKHANIVDIYDFGELRDGRPYYVMELLEGVNLDTYVSARGRLNPGEALEVIEPICAALNAAHEAGIIHRDLKGSNIIIVTSVDPHIVKLLDFGIAKLINQDAPGSGLTSVGRQLGSPHAMAPEQIRGALVDKRTDIYSLGILIYQVLTGRVPFNSEDPLEIELLHLQAPPPRPSQHAPVSPALDEIVIKCLDKDPEKRFSSVLGVLEALKQALGAGSSATQSSGALSLPAVGIYVEVRIQDEESEDMDDALLDDVGNVLQEVQKTLRESGFLLPVETGYVVLGVSLLPQDAEEERRQKQRTLKVARSLYNKLFERPDPHERVKINVCVHVDKALVKTSAQGPVLLGGGIVKIASWVPKLDLNEAVATPQMVEGLLDDAPVRDGYVTITQTKGLPDDAA